MTEQARRAPAVAVGTTRDPLGRSSVLLQVGEQWWLTMSPDEARHLGVMLIAQAEQISDARGEGPRFTCPRCGRTSYHLGDVAERYCGACKDWTGRR